MYLVTIFGASPLMGLSLCVSLATVLWCIILARRQRSGVDKVLTGLLGLIAVYEALRVLSDSGVLLFPGAGKLDGWADFVIACMCLVAAMILKVSSIDRATTQVRLRLVEANEKPLEFAKGLATAVPELAHDLFEASPLATFATDGNDTVIYWNAAAEDLLGWKREEVLGQRLPFAGNGRILDHLGKEIEAAVWTAPIRSHGSTRGTLTIAASDAVLRHAGEFVH